MSKYCEQQKESEEEIIPDKQECHGLEQSILTDKNQQLLQEKEELLLKIHELESENNLLRNELEKERQK